MHTALTDVLTCPRCGPGHGLILLPEEVRERRVWTGLLGCADCRTRYAVRSGVAELSVGAEEVEPVVLADASRPDGADEAVVRMAALLGLTEGSGVVLVAGPAAAAAEALGSMVEGVEVAATIATGVSGVSGVRLGARLPFQTGRLGGVWLSGAASSSLVEEGARVLGPGSRLVVEGRQEGVEERLVASGLRVLAVEGGTVVASR